MDDPTQIRHRAPAQLARPRELVLACPPMKSNINLSRIVRAAGCAGVQRIIVCGNASIDRTIARDGADAVTIEPHRTLAPVLRAMRSDGYRIVALEQTDRSQGIYDFRFQRKAVLVIGNERSGVEPEVLALAEDVIEIPVYGIPHAHNAATAAAIAIYEYCRQFPTG